MNYIDLLNHFWKINKEFSFTPNEKAVYFALLYKWNDLHRKNPFNMSREELAAEAGVSVSSVKRSRLLLEKAELISYDPGDGRRNNTVYLLKSPGKGVHTEPLSLKKGCHSEPLNSTKGVHKEGHTEPLYTENTQIKGSTENHYISNDIEESMFNAKKGEVEEKEEESRQQKTPIPIGNSSVYSSMDDVEFICLNQSTVWQEHMSRKLGLRNLVEAKKWVEEFFDEQRAAGQDKRELNDARSHCYNWIRTQVQKEKGSGQKEKGKAEAVLDLHDASTDYWEQQKLAHINKQNSES